IDRAHERLGPFVSSIESARPFKRDLAAKLDLALAAQGRSERAAPVDLLTGSAVHAQSRSRARGIQIVGIDERFPPIARDDPGFRLGSREIAINSALAIEIGAKVGDEILLYVADSSGVPRETLLGDREQSVERLRVEVARILPDEGLALFDLRQQQATPRNVFIDIDRIGTALGIEGRANLLVVAEEVGGREEGTGAEAEIGRR